MKTIKVPDPREYHYSPMLLRTAADHEDNSGNPRFCMWLRGVADAIESGAATEDEHPVIDPDLIKVGDEVDLVTNGTVTQVEDEYIWLGETLWLKRANETRRTWRLISRPDPDAEAAAALHQAVVGGPFSAPVALRALREAGWDVTKRADQ